MVKCKKCGKETRVICLCGVCPDCNGIAKDMEEDYQRFLEKYKSGKLII